MADDWKPGDLALCVSRFSKSVGAPKPGQVATVIDVTRGSTMQGLVLTEFPNDNPYGWAAFRFRRINPLTDEEREEALRELDAPVKEPRPVTPLSSAGDAA